MIFFLKNYFSNKKSMFTPSKLRQCRSGVASLLAVKFKFKCRLQNSVCINEVYMWEWERFRVKWALAL